MSYQEELIESLKDPEEAALYIEACLEEGDPEVLRLALGDVVEAHRRMHTLSEKGFFYDFSNYGSYERLTDDGLTQWHPAFLQLGSTLEECAQK